MKKRKINFSSVHFSRIAIFDFDGTLVEEHLWKALLKHNFKSKRRVLLSLWHIAYHMFFYYLSKFHFYSYEKCIKNWAEDIPQLFKGIKKHNAEKFFQKIWKEYLKPTIKTKTLNRLKNHQREGYITILASNAPKDFLEIVKEDLNFDFLVGSKVEIKDGKYTGKSVLPIPWREEKLKQIKALLKKEKIKIDFKNSFAYSDSARDVKMLEMVGNPVVVDPDKELFEIAKKENWEFL